MKAGIWTIPGVLIALSSRFHRQPAAIPALVAAVADITEKPAKDCIIYRTT